MVQAMTSITQLISNTPLIKLNRLVPKEAADIYVKVESFNAGGSVKDRIALNMIETAEREGLLQAGDTIIEATSGNTGVGLALVAAAKGYKIQIIMPETMTVERRQLMKAYGAELILTPGDQGMPGAVAKAEELAEQPGYFWARQFENIANPTVHYQKTGQEIIQAFDGRTPDAFIAGIGTGGTITGVGKALREVNEAVRLFAIEPSEAPFLTKGEKGPHKIQGIGAGILPAILDQKLYEEILLVSSEEAQDTMRRLAKEEGILAGVSSGANVFGALEIAKRLGKGHTVVTVLPDTGERYLSTGVFGEA